MAFAGLLTGWIVFWLLSTMIFAMGGGAGTLENTQAKEDLELLGIQDSNAADEFSKIALGLRILPSQKKEGNLEILKMMTGA